MAEPKQKPAGKPVHTADKARLPRTAMRAVWLRTREGTQRLVAEERRDGQYQEAAAQEERAVDVVGSAAEAAGGTALRGGKKLARTVVKKRSESHKAAQAAQAEAAAQLGVVQGKTSGRVQSPSNYSGATSPGQYNGTEHSRAPLQRAVQQNRQNAITRKQAKESSDRLPSGSGEVSGALLDSNKSRLRQDSLARFQVTARRKAQPQQAPRPRTAHTGKEVAKATLAQTRTAKIVQQAKQTAQAAGSAAKKTADAVIAGLKTLWAATHTLVLAIAAGGACAVLVVVIVCMIALVIGSGFGIFFAAEPAGDSMSLADAIAQLNGEYQDRLEEIETNYPHDRLEITSNDGSYAIAWQNVLAVFAARTSGAEDGAPVAYLDEANLERLRQIMWDMNEVTWEVETQTHEVETDPATETAADATAVTTEEDSGTSSSDTTDDSNENEDDPGTTTVTVLASGDRDHILSGVFNQFLSEKSEPAE